MRLALKCSQRAHVGSLLGLSVLILMALGCAEKRADVDSALQDKAENLLAQFHGGHSTYTTSPFTIEMAWFEHGATDDDLKEILRGAPQVRVLKIRYADVTDLGLDLLAENAPYLEHLELSGMPRVTDAGLKFLEEHPRLRYLSLVNTGATEEVARQLEEKLGLETLIFKIMGTSGTGGHESAPTSPMGTATGEEGDVGSGEAGTGNGAP